MTPARLTSLFNERADAVVALRPHLAIHAEVSESDAEFPEKRNYAYCSWDGAKVRIVFSPKILRASTARADALIRHELAHALLMSEEKEHTERETDAMAEEVWGDPIFYDADDVQTLDKSKATTRLRPPYLPNPRPFTPHQVAKDYIELRDASEPGEWWYAVELSRGVWDEDEDDYGDFETLGIWEVDDRGNWKPIHGTKEPEPPTDVEEGIDPGDVYDAWLSDKAPRIAMERIEEELWDMGLAPHGRSGRSEATYLIDTESGARVRVASHDPVYESSYEAFNVLVDVHRGRGAPEQPDTVDLPLLFSQTELRAAMERVEHYLGRKREEWEAQELAEASSTVPNPRQFTPHQAAKIFTGVLAKAGIKFDVAQSPKSEARYIYILEEADKKTVGVRMGEWAVLIKEPGAKRPTAYSSHKRKKDAKAAAQRARAAGLNVVSLHQSRTQTAMEKPRNVVIYKVRFATHDPVYDRSVADLDFDMAVMDEGDLIQAAADVVGIVGAPYLPNPAKR